jgi:hypothetical protein
MPDTDITMHIDGKPYTLDPNDLELGEIELIEEVCDSAFDDIDFTRAKAIRMLVYTVLHREDPTITMDDAKEIKIGAITDAPEAEDKPEPKKRRTTPKD